MNLSAHLLLSPTDSARTGQIGIELNQLERYEKPKPKRYEEFYMNTGYPATSAGSISELQYCYFPDDNDECCQSTVAFYRLENTSNYSIITPGQSYTLWLAPGNLYDDDDNDDFLVCSNVTINPSVQVRKGDVLGACVSDYSTLSIVAKTPPRVEVEDIQRSDNRVFCNNLQSSPDKINPMMLRPQKDRVFLVFAQITSEFV